MRSNEVGCAASACLVVALAATLTSPVALARQSTRSPQPQGVAWSTPTQIMSPVVVASWITVRSVAGVERLQLLVLWRGTSGWFLPDGASGFSFGRSEGHYHQRITEGDLQLSLDYDLSRRVATVHGKTIELGENNVVFVDEVDSRMGPRVTGTMGVERVMPGSAGQIGLVLRTSPEIMSFLRCDATTTDPGKRTSLERLCLENIGIRVPK